METEEYRARQERLKSARRALRKFQARRAQEQQARRRSRQRGSRSHFSSASIVAAAAGSAAPSSARSSAVLATDKHRRRHSRIQSVLLDGLHQGPVGGHAPQRWSVMGVPPADTRDRRSLHARNSSISLGGRGRPLSAADWKHALVNGGPSVPQAGAGAAPAPGQDPPSRRHSRHSRHLSVSTRRESFEIMSGLRVEPPPAPGPRPTPTEQRASMRLSALESASILFAGSLDRKSTSAAPVDWRAALRNLPDDEPEVSEYRHSALDHLEGRVRARESPRTDYAPPADAARPPSWLLSGDSSAGANRSSASKRASHRRSAVGPWNLDPAAVNFSSPVSRDPGLPAPAPADGAGDKAASSTPPSTSPKLDQPDHLDTLVEEDEEDESSRASEKHPSPAKSQPEQRITPSDRTSQLFPPLDGKPAALPVDEAPASPSAHDTAAVPAVGVDADTTSFTATNDDTSATTNTSSSSLSNRLRPLQLSSMLASGTPVTGGTPPRSADSSRASPPSAKTARRTSIVYKPSAPAPAAPKPEAEAQRPPAGHKVPHSAQSSSTSWPLTDTAGSLLYSPESSGSSHDATSIDSGGVPGARAQKHTAGAPSHTPSPPLEFLRKQLHELQQQHALQEVHFQRALEERQRELDEVRMLTSKQLINMAAARDEHAKQALEQENELAALREQVQDLEAERDMYKEDIDGWRSRCSDLEQTIQSQHLRLKQEQTWRRAARHRMQTLTERLESAAGDVSSASGSVSYGPGGSPSAPGPGGMRMSLDSSLSSASGSSVEHELPTLPALPEMPSDDEMGDWSQRIARQLSKHQPAASTAAEPTPEAVRLLSDMRQQIMTLMSELEVERSEHKQTRARLEHAQRGSGFHRAPQHSSSEASATSAEPGTPVVEHGVPEALWSTPRPPQHSELPPPPRSGDGGMVVNSTPKSDVMVGRNNRHAFALDAGATPHADAPSLVRRSALIDPEYTADTLFPNADQSGEEISLIGLGLSAEQDRFNKPLPAAPSMSNLFEHALEDSLDMSTRRKSRTSDERASPDGPEEKRFSIGTASAEPTPRMSQDASAWSVTVDSAAQGRPVSLDLEGGAPAEAEAEPAPAPARPAVAESDAATEREGSAERSLSPPEHTHTASSPDDDDAWESEDDTSSGEVQLVDLTKRPEFIREWSFAQAMFEAERELQSYRQHGKHGEGMLSRRGSARAKPPPAEDFFGILSEVKMLPPLPTPAYALEMPAVDPAQLKQVSAPSPYMATATKRGAETLGGPPRSSRARRAYQEFQTYEFGPAPKPAIDMSQAHGVPHQPSGDLLADDSPTQPLTGLVNMLSKWRDAWSPTDDGRKNSFDFEAHDTSFGDQTQGSPVPYPQDTYDYGSQAPEVFTVEAPRPDRLAPSIPPPGTPVPRSPDSMQAARSSQSGPRYLRANTLTRIPVPTPVWDLNFIPATETGSAAQAFTI